jgi:hypothetical protein
LLAVRRLALVVVLVLLTGALAACGSGSKKSTTSSGPSNTEQIKTAYVKFFSSKTPLATRVSLLQNGSKFTPLISALAKNPLASDTSATVSSVTMVSPVSANVVYTVKISGTPIPGLKNRKGTAVRANANSPWTVGDASFCALVELQGSTPSVCKS